MIQRESGVLCDATSLALNVFDILKGDAIRGKKTEDGDESLGRYCQRCGFQEKDSDHEENEEKSGPGGWSKQSVSLLHSY